MVVEGYKFNSENSANGAQAQLRVHYLGSAHSSCTTTEWVEVLHNTGSEGDFYYILNDEQIGNVLNPHKLETFTINIEGID